MSLAVELIKRHEGCKLTAYKDTLGIWTIGWGYAQGVRQGDVWTQEQADNALLSQIAACEKDLKAYDWYKGLDGIRQAVIVDMRYQLGLSGLMNFKKFRQALADKQWMIAAREGLNSRWAQQTPTRARENMEIIAQGLWPLQTHVLDKVSTV